MKNVIRPNPFAKSTTEIITTKGDRTDKRLILTYDMRKVAERKNTSLAESSMDAIIGQDHLKTFIRQTASLMQYHMVRSELLGVRAEPKFNNIAIGGPPGTGKTTAGIVYGAFLAANGVLKNPKVLVATISDIKGGYIGDSELYTRNIIEKARGGVLVIDEADTLNISDSFHRGIREALNGSMDKERDYGTIFIITGYRDGIDKLLNSNPGLNRRFPNLFYFDHFVQSQLATIFENVLERRGYEVDEAIVRRTVTELERAKAFLGHKFGNASTVENLVDDMELKRNSRFTPDILCNYTAYGISKQEMRQALEQFDEYDIPHFDTKAGRFIPQKFGNQLFNRDQPKAERPTRTGRAVLSLAAKEKAPG